MTLKALPKKLLEEWRVAECDPTGETEYIIAPLSNTAITHISGRHIIQVPIIDEETGQQKLDEDEEPLFGGDFNFGAVQIDKVRFSLKNVKGLIDPDTGQSFQLVFVQEKIAGQNHAAVRADCLDRLPKALYEEISQAVGAMDNTPNKEEEENANFTSTSSHKNLQDVPIAEGMSPDAPTDATEGSLPSDSEK